MRFTARVRFTARMRFTGEVYCAYYSCKVLGHLFRIEVILGMREIIYFVRLRNKFTQ